MAKHALRATVMPIAPVDEHTQLFEAGDVTIGVEYRLLTNDIVSRSVERQGKTLEGEFDDRGVSLHVYAGVDGAERLRFDCFDEGPHYHYVNWTDQANEIVQIDPVADGDPLAWALDRIRTRLPQMLARAGASDTAASVDMAAIESVLPRVAEAAYRARYHHDDAATMEAALA